MHWGFDDLTLFGRVSVNSCGLSTFMLNIGIVEFGLVVLSLPALDSEESPKGREMAKAKLQSQGRPDMKKGLSMRASGAQ